MKTLSKKLGSERYITDANGEVESVILSLAEYEKVINLLEDYGLGLAMKEAESDKTFDKGQALKYLDNA